MSVGGSAVGLPSPLNAAPRRGVNPQRCGVACRQVHEAPMMFDRTVAEQVRQQTQGVIGQSGVNKGFLPLQSLCSAAAR